MLGSISVFTYSINRSNPFENINHTHWIINSHSNCAIQREPKWPINRESHKTLLVHNLRLLPDALIKPTKQRSCLMPAHAIHNIDLSRKCWKFSLSTDKIYLYVHLNFAETSTWLPNAALPWSLRMTLI